MKRHTNEQQTENDDKLVNAVAQDVLGHGAGDKWLVAAVWFPHEQRFSRWFCGQSQGCKSVHDKVHPQHLYSFQWRILVGKKAKVGQRYNTLWPLW